MLQSQIYTDESFVLLCKNDSFEEKKKVYPTVQEDRDVM